MAVILPSRKRRAAGFGTTAEAAPARSGLRLRALSWTNLRRGFTGEVHR